VNRHYTFHLFLKQRKTIKVAPSASRRRIEARLIISKRTAQMTSLKTTIRAATLMSAVFLTSLPSHAQNAEAHSANDLKVQLAVATASKAWKDAFNAGDAAGAAAMYEDDATMVVKPFGTFSGRDEILAFWADIIGKGFDDVVYANTITTVLDGESARVAADWTMNKARGIITNELWVVQPDGRALLSEDHFEITQ